MNSAALMITDLNLTQSWPELNLSLSHSLLSYKNNVQLYCSTGNKITLHGQKTMLRWKNSLVSVCDERTLWSSERRTRDKCMSCFSRGITGAESQEKQTGLWENYLFNLSLSSSFTLVISSLALSLRGLEEILCLWGFLGRGKELMSSTSRWQCAEKDEGRGPLIHTKLLHPLKGNYTLSGPHRTGQRLYGRYWTNPQFSQTCYED